MISIFNFDFW